MDGVDHDAIPRRLCRRRRRNAIRRIQKTLVVTRIVLLVEPSGKTEIGQFDVTILVNKDVVRLDVSVAIIINGYALDSLYAPLTDG